MRTAVYIDGYNLYFGAVKDTEYKWLDVVKLFKGICHIQDPATDITSVKYFTAPVISRVASRGEIALHSQTTYHRALRSSYPKLLEIIEGYFTLEKGKPPRYKKPIDKDDRIDVWRLEEKQSDVNIALSMYRDALSGNYDQVVLISVILSGGLPRDGHLKNKKGSIGHSMALSRLHTRCTILAAISFYSRHKK